jgi:hypothetical protein
MKKPKVIHPFILAVYPIIFLLSNNIEETNLSIVIYPVLITIVSSGVVLLLSALLKVSLQKTGILLSVFWVIFFFHGHVYDLVVNMSIGGFNIGRNRYLLLLWLLWFATVSVLIFRSKMNFYNLTKILNVIGFVLLFMPLVSIGYYTVTQDQNSINDTTSELGTGDSDTDESHIKPDIYYIVLDAYGREDILQENFGYDNSNFINYLTENGFFIGSNSFANYPRTPYSLASSLNMDYLNDLESYDFNNLYEIIQENRAVKFLKNRGYTFINFDSGWGPTADMKDADIQFRNTVFNDFYNVLFQSTVLAVFSGKLLGVQYDRVLFTFNNLNNLLESEKPKFVFAHIMCPHPPFVFERDGTPTPYKQFLMDGDIWEQNEAYINQLVYVSNLVKDLVQKLQNKSGNPPIIIFQSDHGPSFSKMPSNPVTEWHDTNGRNYLKEKMSILNAYYFPPGSQAVLYDSISPVNTFRTIFNEYHNANFEILEDRHFFLDKENVFKTIDVTNNLR